MPETVINYRQIFDQLRNYEFASRPTLKSVALIANENYDEVFKAVAAGMELEVWDEETQLDQRSIQDFKRDYQVLPSSKLFYIKRNGTIIGLFTKSPLDGTPCTAENVVEISEKVLDDWTRKIVNDELVTRVVNELIETDLGELNAPQGTLGVSMADRN